MISTLIKRVMKECGLQQKALSEVLGVELDRVKNITSGRVKKLTREEGEALIKKLNIRGDWLATGEGPMFQSAGEREFQRRLDELKSATDTATALPEDKQRLMQELLFYVGAGDIAALTAAISRVEIVSPGEAALLDNYRHAPPEGKAALKAVCAALEKPKHGKKAG